MKNRSLVVSRIVSAIEMNQFKEITDGTLAKRRMFAQCAARKALRDRSEDALETLAMLDSYAIADAIHDGKSIWGAEVDHVIKSSIDGYYYSHV